MQAAAQWLLDSPRLPDLARLLRQPAEVFAWELDGLRNGTWGAAPQGVRDLPNHDSFVKVSRFLASWSAAPDPKVALEFEALEPATEQPWGIAYLRLHQAFGPLLRRDWKAAAQRLDAAAALGASLSPKVGISWSRGAAALAAILASGDPRASDGSPLPTPCMHDDRKRWNDTYWSFESPIGREWMAAAELVEARRYGPGSPRDAEAKGRATLRCPKPRTAPLRWLLDHPTAPFAEIERELPIEPCRCAWWSILHFLFRNLAKDEFDRLAAIQDERLAEMSRKQRFDVVVLTYLAEDMTMVNERLRRLAATEHWPLADVHANHSRAEIEADDRKRYFSPDRGHPNDDGYALIAQEAFEALQRFRPRR